MLHLGILKPSPYTYPDDKTCTDKPQKWNVAKEFKGGLVLFSDMLFVHLFGKLRGKEKEIRMGKDKIPCMPHITTESQDLLKLNKKGVMAFIT